MVSSDRAPVVEKLTGMRRRQRQPAEATIMRTLITAGPGFAEEIRKLAGFCPFPYCRSMFLSTSHCVVNPVATHSASASKVMLLRVWRTNSEQQVGRIDGGSAIAVKVAHSPPKDQNRHYCGADACAKSSIVLL